MIFGIFKVALLAYDVAAMAARLTSNVAREVVREVEPHAPTTIRAARFASKAATAAATMPARVGGRVVAAAATHAVVGLFRGWEAVARRLPLILVGSALLYQLYENCDFKTPSSG